MAVFSIVDFAKLPKVNSCRRVFSSIHRLCLIRVCARTQHRWVWFGHFGICGRPARFLRFVLLWLPPRFQDYCPFSVLLSTRTLYNKLIIIINTTIVIIIVHFMAIDVIMVNLRAWSVSFATRKQQSWENRKKFKESLSISHHHCHRHHHCFVHWYDHRHHHHHRDWWEKFKGPFPIWATLARNSQNFFFALHWSRQWCWYQVTMM